MKKNEEKLSQPNKSRRTIDQNSTYEINRIKVEEKVLHFSFLHTLTKFWQQSIVVLIISFLFSFISLLLVQNTGLYGLGLDALSHSIARLAAFIAINSGKSDQLARVIFNICFWMVNFVINIPLFIFASIKINKNFAILTMLFMLFATIFGIAFSSISGSENWLILGKVIDSNFTSNAIKQPNNIVQITTWAVNYSGQNGNNPISIMFYGLLWAIIQGALAAALLIVNSTTAGFDIFVVWYSQKKFKNLGFIYIAIHIVCLLAANTIGTYLPSGLATGNWNIELFFNASFASSFIMILVNGIVVDILFPKYKMVKIEAYTSKPKEILDKIFALKDKRFSATIANFKGGYSGEMQQVLIINTMYIESSVALKIINEIDPNAMICMFDIKRMKGTIYTSNIVNKDRK
ncbi:Hypothetical protein, predicted transmembrane protein [Mycoplasmopsis agalactiae 14628]|uniref:DUF2179 domain-containing protein n=1 Tax=Mycoplasmopsis agalactiae 14628 TaxID=1110504 RepID=I5D5H7_MYCAA|nr:DUF2179 domain-containing protein [Mycoplasmopsis agalactiae]EIN14936.1 Hypothetical protein, predicted transmembrane protein [Mycoplasmopsis agalactiae 14628]